MFVEQNVKVGFRDVDDNLNLTNKALLGYLEDIAGVHSSQVGYGLLDIPETHLTWFLISWKVKIIKRPLYNDDIIVKTWSKNKNKIYAFRNFHILDKAGNVIAIASSKWVPIDTESGNVIKVEDEIFDKYKSESIQVFEDEENFKVKEPENYDFDKEYYVTKNMIDMQKHVHNTYYMDFVTEILPENIDIAKLNEFEIIYKKQIPANSNVKIFYSKIEEEIFVAIKSEDEKTLHAIIKMK